MWKKLDQQQVRPRLDRGCDWDGVRQVMARKGDREVWWRPGHHYWDGVGYPQAYQRAGLVLVDGLGYLPTTDYLFEGHFSPTKLQEHLKAIAKHLGVAVSELPALHPKATFVWED